jgi:uncharacterized protein
MTGRLVSITRYVVKGLPGEPLARLELVAGRGVPNDRRFAFALADTAFDPARPEPLPKTKFVMLMRFARLARLTSRYDDLAGTLTVSANGGTLVAARLGDAQGRTNVERAFAAFMSEDLPRPARLVEAAGHRFTDVSVVSPKMMEAVSLINLGSVRALERAIGRRIDPRRFRGNLLVDGIEPWAELDWIDREISIGGVRFRGALRTRRCAATEVNPETAERDIKLPTELMKQFKHGDMGIYLYVDSSGFVAPGDAVVPPLA